jgi:F0F1-type ATP synthase assembly protein I
MHGKGREMRKIKLLMVNATICVCHVVTLAIGGGVTGFTLAGEMSYGNLIIGIPIMVTAGRAMIHEALAMTASESKLTGGRPNY